METTVRISELKQKITDRLAGESIHPPLLPAYRIILSNLKHAENRGEQDCDWLEELATAYAMWDRLWHDRHELLETGELLDYGVIMKVRRQQHWWSRLLRRGK